MDRTDQPRDRQLMIAQARLAETLGHIARLTNADAGAFPILNSGDLPRLRDLGLPSSRQPRTSLLWLEIETAVEHRVMTVDPTAGGEIWTWCYPVYVITDAHWRSLLESAALYVTEPLLPAASRAFLEPRVNPWTRYAATARTEAPPS